MVPLRTDYNCRIFSAVGYLTDRPYSFIQLSAVGNIYCNFEFLKSWNSLKTNEIKQTYLSEYKKQNHVNGPISVPRKGIVSLD